MAGDVATSPAVRVGYGRDSHAFGPGTGLRLGGIEIAAAPRLHGHSDGDVALHAIAGALLGAAGLGDLGSLFPADNRTPAGIASADLVREVVGRVAAAGWAATAIDVLITAARPRLGEHLDTMRTAIAGLVGLDPSAVSVAASSGNLSGDDGAGRTVSAASVATLVATGASR
jgi:2-C-methyl-D-erythritol 2,4-cyclodiphosphate synthase